MLPVILNILLLPVGTLLICIATAAGKRHTVYWDVSLEPRLKNELKLEVDVDDWMDILCPHKSSFNRSSATSDNLYLEVYNVSSRHYKYCAVTNLFSNHYNLVFRPGKKYIFLQDTTVQWDGSSEIKIELSCACQRRLLHCKDPRQEIKLTTKFQTRSPSPIGFIFQPGQTYYYLSKPIQKKNPGCTSDTLRMTIKVRESREGKTKQRLPTRNSNGVIHKNVSFKPKRHHDHAKTAPSEGEKSKILQGIGSARKTVTSSGASKNKPTNSAQSTLRMVNAKCWLTVLSVAFLQLIAASIGLA